MPWPAFIAIAFICGSIPFGLLIARTRGVDLRAHGSGNIGATNVWRVMGRGPGLTCFVLDVIKGLVPVLGAGLAKGLVPASVFVAPIAPADAWWWLGTLAGAILGHMFTPWAGFKGGKGVATGLGAALGVAPVLALPALAAFALWCVVVKITRMVSVASCVAAAAIPVLVWAWARASAQCVDVAPFVIATSVIGGLVVVRHRANLVRVWKGTENRIGRRPAAGPAVPPVPGASASTPG